MQVFELLTEAKVVWKPVVGWPKYEVSNTGLVRVKATQHILRQERHYGKDPSQPYRRVMLRDFEARANVRVSRAVAMAFLGLPPPGQVEVDHIDGNRENNNVTNLEWVTPYENQRRKLAAMNKRKSLIDAQPVSIS